MSKSARSASKSRSNSRSRSRSRPRSRSGSRSRSRSVSCSRSQSRSRSRRRRYSSRSRSRSRSRSPTKARERKYPKGYQSHRDGYQGNREFRGFHRGFRRPYHFRGRGRGYFPRGRFQRGGGGGGGYNNNFRPNWKNFRQCPPHQQHQHQHQQHQHQPPQQQQQQQQNHTRGRSPSPKRCPESLPPGGPEPRSDHSPCSPAGSGRSRRSSVSSRSSRSPRRSSASERVDRKACDRNEEERPSSKEARRSRGGDEEAGECAGGEAGGGGDGSDGGKWRSLTECSSGLKKASTPECSAVTDGQIAPTTNRSSASPKHQASVRCNGTPSWQVVGNKSPSQKSQKPVFSGFGAFSKEDDLDGDRSSISAAFKKFLEENNSKASSGQENGQSRDSDGEKMEAGHSNGKASDCGPDPKSRRRSGDLNAAMSLNSFLKASPFLCGDDDNEEEEEEEQSLGLVMLQVERQEGDESCKTKGKSSALEMFKERFSRWQSTARRQVARDEQSGLTQVCCSQKQEKKEAVLAGCAKRELACALLEPCTLLEPSPERSGKFHRTETRACDASPSSQGQRASFREMLTARGGDPPPAGSRDKEAKFNVRMDFLRDRLTSCSEVLAGERQMSQDLVQSSKKEQEFRAIFQHVEARKLQRSPSELFTQHIVTIVHHVNAQYFPSAGGSLNDRFSAYQRQAAQQEMRKARKSPEIHRRIDVSPSAFKKHSHLFEAMKSSEDGSDKDGAAKMRSDSMDLRLDIERRKKASVGERPCNQDVGRDLGESAGSGKERAFKKSSKRHKKSKKSRKKRSRSTSSSSSSSSSSDSHCEGNFPRCKSDVKELAFDTARLGQQDLPGPAGRARSRGGFSIVRGRGWNKGNHHGNGIHSNPPNMETQSQNEDWDPEYTPKSKQYFLHDDREGEGESGWPGGRGRGRGLVRARPRFIIRKAVGGTNSNNKFQVNGKLIRNPEEEAGQLHGHENV